MYVLLCLQYSYVCIFFLIQNIEDVLKEKEMLSGQISERDNIITELQQKQSDDNSELLSEKEEFLQEKNRLENKVCIIKYGDKRFQALYN